MNQSSACQTGKLTTSQPVNLLICHSFNLSTNQLINLLTSQLVNLSTFQPVQLSTYLIIKQSTCQIVHLINYQPANRFDSLSKCQKIIFSTYQTPVKVRIAGMEAVDGGTDDPGLRRALDTALTVAGLHAPVVLQID